MAAYIDEIEEQYFSKIGMLGYLNKKDCEKIKPKIIDDINHWAKHLFFIGIFNDLFSYIKDIYILYCNLNNVKTTAYDRGHTQGNLKRILFKFTELIYYEVSINKWLEEKSIHKGEDRSGFSNVPRNPSLMVDYIKINALSELFNFEEYYCFINNDDKMFTVLHNILFRFVLIYKGIQHVVGMELWGRNAKSLWLDQHIWNYPSANINSIKEQEFSLYNSDPLFSYIKIHDEFLYNLFIKQWKKMFSLYGQNYNFKWYL